MDHRPKTPDLKLTYKTRFKFVKLVVTKQGEVKLADAAVSTRLKDNILEHLPHVCFLIHVSFQIQTSSLGFGLRLCAMGVWESRV